MKKAYWLYILLLWIVALSGHSQTVTLGGHVKLVDAENFNGFLRLKLSGANVKNICTAPPYKVVPTLSVTMPIVNGILQSTGNFLSQDCMSPRIPYYIEVSDTNNLVVASDNWYLPRTITASVDVGDMSEEKFNGPINVAIPQGIIANPSGNQTVTQLGGTSFTFNGVVNLNGAVNFGATPTFNIIDTNQLLVGGITSSPYALDVQGYIDATSGYLVNGSGGSIGQCITSDGTSGKWGACGPAFPTLYNQTIQFQGLVQNQRSNVNFADADFVIADDATNNATVVGLNASGPVGPLLRVAAALPTGNTNCLQGDGNGSVQYTAFPCYNNTSVSDRYTTVTGCYFGAYNNLVSCGGTFIWNTPFADTNYVVTGCTANTGNAASVIVSISGPLTTTGFTYTQTLVMENGSGSGWVPTFSCHGHHN